MLISGFGRKRILKGYFMGWMILKMQAISLLLKVKWISLQWRKLASVIVSVSLMVHHHQFLKRRFQLKSSYDIGRILSNEDPFDTKYQYLWNCKEYFKKASRIILATDGDLPGQALAEELARRLGRERCWRVKWPKKNDVDHFKDANEVLMNLGPSVLKDVIDNAELYPIHG